MTLIDDYKEEKECVYKNEHYRVRDNGAVMRLQIKGKKCRSLDNIWTFGTKNQATGYKSISGHRIHIIVATAFHGVHDSKVFVVDHIDTNRSNNRPENLRWLTKLENILLNPITRAKVEYICGSIENFLADPTQLRGHEMKDRNFEWMRAVSKEEAENTLRNWKKLMEKPHQESTNGGLGEWLISGNLKEEVVKEVNSTRTPIFTNEIQEIHTINTDKYLIKRRQKIEQIKKDKEVERRLNNAIGRQQAREEKRQKERRKRDIVSVISSYAQSRGWNCYINAKGEGWSTDILLVNGEKKIAFQLPTTYVKTHNHLKVYENNGMKVYWLGDGYVRNPETDMLTPYFSIQNENGGYHIRINDSQCCSIEDFVYYALHNNLIIEDSMFIKSVKVRFMPNSCYYCGTEHYTFFVLGFYTDEDKTLSTYEGIYNSNAEFDEFDPILIDGVKKFLAEHSNLKYNMGDIKKRFSRTINESYMSFGCPHCDSIVGDFYLNDNKFDAVYEPDDEFVHTIRLEGQGLKVNMRHWKIVL